MRVYKFGGASVKDAKAIQQLKKILSKEDLKNLTIVISAIGKTTNALETIAHEHYYSRSFPKKAFEAVKAFHLEILQGLFSKATHNIFNEVHNLFAELEWILEDIPGGDYDLNYDQIVSFGELFSTKIVAAYLREQGILNHWVDARDFLKTDSTFRTAKIDWKKCTDCFNSKATVFKERLTITQGFIGSDSDNNTTTLGREGSDFSASILAYFLNANEVKIWKDVDGVLNADPKYFSDTTLITEMSYQDAVELSYYGASVIHPKTIKPLQNKSIPLHVCSFVNLNSKGTWIGKSAKRLTTPCFIFKKEQTLVSISPRDYSFIDEGDLENIFKQFKRYGIQINTMQNSALSFSACFDSKEDRFLNLKETLSELYEIRFNTNLELITIRNYNKQTIQKLVGEKEILLETKSRYTAQLVLGG